MRPLELWGGIECTVNRVGDRYVDQLEESGHARRDDDIDRMAALGIRTWRYPILWERVAPNGLADADWEWVDRRLSRMRALGLDPIVGLVHHGSGPRSTHLLDPGFAEGLAAYAAAVAARHPWVRRWTPVNEPLSTARFAALDGHWYPHGTSETAFARALVNECRGIVLAMRAIRRHVPDAELVLTEDGCRQSATGPMLVEATFRSERRWLAHDLVMGRVVPAHPFHDWLVSRGIPADELAALAEQAVTPAIVGVNYYVTSDRFLDHDLERHVPWRRFRTDAGPYAETETVRCTEAGITGHRAILVETWQRYGLPVALTEVHLGCTREEQVRWLLEAWDAARLARADGADVRAITTWGAFGLVGWDQLVTQPGGTYEPGLWDVRAPAPRPTALAKVASALATGREPDVPYGGPGWWRRPLRLLGRPPIRAIVLGDGPDLPLPPPRPSRPLLVTGSGALAREILRACDVRGLVAVAPGRDLDLDDPDDLARVFDAVAPWAVIHAAGVRGREHAERDPERCARLHARAPAHLAAASAPRGIRFAMLSSSLVLPGPGPHPESAPIAPRTVLGRAQAEGERAVLAAHPGALVLRCGFVLGLDRDDDPLRLGLARLQAKGVWAVPAHAPAAVAPLLVDALLDLLVDGEQGVFHLAHRRPLGDVARDAARLAGLDPARVVEEPSNAAFLVSERGPALPPPTAALGPLVARCRPARSAEEGREAVDA